MTDHRTVAVVGAGIGGLVCAQRLSDAGFRVRVFDKSRGVGGRMSVRRGDCGTEFDHGAQYFTVKNEAFAEHVARWTRVGVVAPWEGRIGTLRAGRWSPTESATNRYVGVPGMTAVAKHLAADLDIVLQCRVTNVVRVPNGWRLTTEVGKDAGTFDVLILNAPAAQSAALISEFPEFAQRISEAEIAPCQALMLAFEHRLALPWDAAFVEESPVSWIARNSSKPGRPVLPDCWVLHANSDWSNRHLEDTPESITAALLAGFEEAVGRATPRPIMTSVHRWRFALPTKPLAQHCLFDAELQLGACGDWCGGPRVEGAWQSGRVLAETLIARA